MHKLAMAPEVTQTAALDFAEHGAAQPVRSDIPANVSALYLGVLNALPQTQCTQCGYEGCAPYAQAIALGEADIDRCPPGGSAGVVALSQITGLAVKPVNPSCGTTKPRHIAVIDASRCIGCTLCITACPVDAIVGAPKAMHQVIQGACTGCDLCLPPCPVDCISMQRLDGFLDWSRTDAQRAQAAHTARLQRLASESALNSASRPIVASVPQHLPLPTQVDPTHKQLTIASALEKARARRMNKHNEAAAKL
jgi:Na+-translocating ferredoxin:NAD+ oxidoreductase subunit B